MTFKITDVKQLLSKHCQNNVLFKEFSHITMHKMRASVHFATGIKSGFLRICPLLFLQLLIFLPFYSQKLYCFSMTFHDFPGQENDII